MVKEAPLGKAGINEGVERWAFRAEHAWTDKPVHAGMWPSTEDDLGGGQTPSHDIANDRYGETEELQGTALYTVLSRRVIS